MLYSHSIGSSVMLSFGASGPRLGRLRPAMAWTAVVGVLVACSFVGCGIGTAVAELTAGPNRTYADLFWKSLQFSLPICLVIGVGGRDRGCARSARELERERAEKLATEARLSSLESRVHPHILFNALNSISALI